MVDLGIAPNASGNADIVFEDGELQLDLGLRSMVLVSLYSDRRADPEEVQPGWDGDVGGWFAQPAGFGSLLWILERRVANARTAAEARDWTKRALEWLRERDIAREILVDVRIQNREQLVISITVKRAGGLANPELWDAEFDQPASLLFEGVLLHLIAA